MKKASIFLAGLMIVAGLCCAADEITVTAVLKVSNGNFDLTRTVSNYKVDQTGTSVDYGIKAIAVGATNNIPISNVTSPGYCFIRNLATTNSIFVTLVMELAPGDVAVFPGATTNITTYSTAGTNDLEYWVNQR